MKHIVIDARLYGPKHTGLGRYTKNLLRGISKSSDFQYYKFTLLVYPELKDEIRKDLGDDFNYYTTSFRHYSISEQLFLPVLLVKLRPDLVHFTHLDKPILYFGNSIVTIHDLIRHFSKGSDTTTKNPLLYWPKYFGYLLMTKITISTSNIIVPSNFWRDFIISKFNINKDKIVTTHEAVDPTFTTSKNKCVRAHSKYILYTGNLYPHKNIPVIFKALKLLPDVKLKIICARDVFLKRAHLLAKRLNVISQVEFLGYIPDSEFNKIYRSAIALVHPSLLEGFSLTGLEAMSLCCPVIASNSSCLPEIYGDSVLYFEPYDEVFLAKQIQNLQTSVSLRQKMIKLGLKQVKKYSWENTANKTLIFYKKTLT